MAAAVLLVTSWLFASLIVYLLLRRYRHPRSTHPLILTAVFLSWLLPLSITFLLPIDISSTRYEKCLSLRQHPDCYASLLYVPASYRKASWYFVYWSTFSLSWLLVPFLQGFVMGGQFHTTRKIIYSLRLNLLFYGMSLAIVLLLALYLRLATTLNQWSAISAFLMALSNAIGLLAVVFFLGHGLVRIPRHLWHSADPRRQLSKCELKAFKVHSAAKEAELHLASVIREIQSLPLRSAQLTPSIQKHISTLLQLIPSTYQDNELISSIGHISEEITLEYLEELHYKIKDCLATCDRTVYEWENLLERAFHYQDVLIDIESGNNRDNIGKIILQWASPLFRRFLSIGCMILSAAIFWGELTLPFSTGTLLFNNTDQNPITILSQEAISTLFLLYMALCTYSSFLKIKIFSYFSLVPGQHTDHKSLLFFAAYFARLTFPLGYNYVTLIDRDGNTQFAQVMGTMNLVPLLGDKYFNLYVPLSISIICFISLFRFHKQDHSDIDPADLDDGRLLVSHARRRRDRLGEAPNTSGTQHGYTLLSS